MGAARIIKAAAVVMSLAAMFIASCSKSEDQICTQVGCHSGADITVDLEANESALNGATVSLCYNGTCWSGLIGAADAGPDVPSDLGEVRIDLSGAPFYEEAQLDSTDGGKAELTFSYNVFPGADGGDFDFELDGAVVSMPIHDGDAFEIRVVTASGATMFDQTQTAAYSELVQPNGAVCGPTCHRAEIVMSQ